MGGPEDLGKPSVDQSFWERPLIWIEVIILSAGGIDKTPVDFSARRGGEL